MSRAPIKFGLANLLSCRHSETRKEDVMNPFVQLNDGDKLRLLQEHSFYVSWPSLDDQAFCTHCRRTFNGRDVLVRQIGQALFLQCPTPGCDGCPLDWASARGRPRRATAREKQAGTKSRPKPKARKATGLTRHLQVLLAKTISPQDASDPYGYFLKKVLAQKEFYKQSQQTYFAPLKMTLLRELAMDLGQQGKVKDYVSQVLPKHGFYHGAALIPGCSVYFYYFEKADIGLLVVHSKADDENMGKRFRIDPDAGPDPQWN